MNSIESRQRILSAETNNPLSALAKPDEITPERWGPNSTFDNLMMRRCSLDDSPNMSLMEIRQCRRLLQTKTRLLLSITSSYEFREKGRIKAGSV